jgi:hypothetical protein
VSRLRDARRASTLFSHRRFRYPSNSRSRRFSIGSVNCALWLRRLWLGSQVVTEMVYLGSRDSPNRYPRAFAPRRFISTKARRSRIKTPRTTGATTIVSTWLGTPLAQSRKISSPGRARDPRKARAIRTTTKRRTRSSILSTPPTLPARFPRRHGPRPTREKHAQRAKYTPTGSREPLLASSMPAHRPFSREALTDGCGDPELRAPIFWNGRSSKQLPKLALRWTNCVGPRKNFTHRGLPMAACYATGGRRRGVCIAARFGPL